MKDPLQPDLTAYEVLGLGAGAMAADVERAFKEGLLRRDNVQKLTAAKRVLQQPLERALVDAFLYDPTELGSLDPNPLADPACLAPPRRWRTATAWEAALRARFPDPRVVHSLAILLYWGALHVERNGDRAEAPAVQQLWERAIACWVALISTPSYWTRFNLSDPQPLTKAIVERLRSVLQDCEQPYRDRGADAEAEIYQELEEALDTEVSGARQVAAEGPGHVACGPLMLKYVGVELAAEQLGRAGVRNLGAVIRAAGSAFPRVRELLRKGNPQAALVALDAVAIEEENLDEASDLRSEAYHALAQQQDSLDQPLDALASWEKALAFCDDRARERDIREMVVSRATARAVALERRDPAGAMALLERARKVVDDERLRLTLAELVMGRGIDRINTAIDAGRAAPGRPSADVIASARAGVADLEYAAEIGSDRAQEQCVRGRRILMQMQWAAREPIATEFNTLPAATRQRFVRAAAREKGPAPPIVVQPVSPSPHGMTAIVLAALVLAGLVMSAFGSTPDSSFYQGPERLFLLYVPLLMLVMFGWRALRYRRGFLAALPYRPGRYLFRSTLVDATSSVIKARPFNDLQELTPDVVRRNNQFAYMDLRFRYKDGTVETLRVSSQNAAQQTLDALREAEKEENELLRTSDATVMTAMFDPFFGVTTGEDAMATQTGTEPTAAPVPDGWKTRRVRTAIAAVLVAVVIWAGRNLIADANAYAVAELRNTEQAYLSYLQQGSFYAGEARARLPQAALQDAKRANTVTAFRAVIARYPASEVVPEARATIHALFERSFAAFQAQASNDPKMLAFVRALLRYLEQSSNPTVEVRFRTPSTTQLAAADLALRGGYAGRRVVPIAEYFDANSSGPRAKAIFEQLRKGFSAIFPADVLNLSLGSLVQTAFAQAANPTFDVAYLVRPSGSFYERTSTSSLGFDLGGSSSDPLYTGIRVAFDVAMRIPERSDALAFNFEVRPPPQFSLDRGSSDAAIYATMADRAFDDLSKKLQELFFRADSTVGRGVSERR